MPLPLPPNYWVPPLVSGGLTATLAFLIVLRRPSRPGAVLALYLLSTSIWSIGYCFQLRAATLPEQVFWSKVQYIGPAGTSLAGLVFVLQYAGFNDWVRTKRLLLLGIIPALTQLFVWTNERHGLIWKRVWLDAVGPYQLMGRTHGLWFWIFLSYSYILILVAILLMGRELLSRRGIYRSQTFVLLLGCIVPLVFNVMYAFNLQPSPGPDLTTFGFSVTGISMAWGLFRFQLPAIMPLARQRVFEGMNDGAIALDTSGNIVDVNSEASRILGQDAGKLIGCPASRVFLTYPELAALCSLDNDKSVSFSVHKFGKLRCYEASFSLLRTPKHYVVGSLIVLHDVTEREAAETALRQAHVVLEQRIAERTADLSHKIGELRNLKNEFANSANHDSLTGLANRKLFLERLSWRLQLWSTDDAGPFAILFLDLDRFKIYNDGFGHHVGDLILTEMGHRLESCLRPSDIAARIGGDEFTVLLDPIEDVHEASRMALHCLEALAKPAHLEGNDIHLTGSIGIAVSGAGCGTAEELVRDADLAMYRAKKQGGNQTAFFGESMRSAALSLVYLERDLHAAVARNQIMVHYQPFVHMLTEKIVGFEALVRWQHPERGVLSAAQFLPIAEQAGLLITIDEFVLREACRQRDLWSRALPPGAALPFVSINISGWQLAHPHRWWQVLSTLDCQTSGLRLEMLESVLVANAHAAVEFFEQVRAHNLQIYLDDFGTGYSSLTWLSQFPIHSLKIDRSFVKDVATSAKDISIVRAIIALARSLEIDVVAEGIESIQQSEVLQDLGCEYGQGFYFSPAVNGTSAMALFALTPGIAGARHEMSS